MAWRTIIGQERVKRILARAIAERRIAHAYCFWGNEGIGKDALALEFAAVMNCEQPHVDSEGITERCGVCWSCIQASHLRHPNIQLVFSLPAARLSGNTDSDSSSVPSPIAKLSDEQIHIIQEQLRLKAVNPYHNITIPNAVQIRIASIREIKKQISMSAPQHGRRVVIISEADAMNQEAANAFLKTLEEPSANVTIILTTSRRDHILSTILSRCQQIRCDVLSDEDISTALVERQGVPKEEARLIARLADGSYSKACELLGEDLQQLRTEIVRLLRVMLAPRFILRLTHELEELTGKATGERDRVRIERMLILLLTWMRDAYTLSVSGGHQDMIINIDQLGDLRRFVQRFGVHGNLDAAARAIEQAIERLRRNANIILTLITLALDLRRILYAQQV
ncbi:MAG: AAA family ATPase [Bacteroidota bacterium]|nr:AAA family ATPase [Candidatus Kapabacteria bacterium]MDW8219533.1 AAA family ATPase [Bacteroidota bacterium]